MQSHNTTRCAMCQISLTTEISCAIVSTKKERGREGGKEERAEEERTKKVEEEEEERGEIKRT